MLFSARCVGDVLFVIDNSDGVGSALSFNKIKNFMIDLIQRVTVSSDLVRVSVVTYSDSGNVSHLKNFRISFCRHGLQFNTWITEANFEY